MNRIATLVAAAVVSVIVSACHNRNPNITYSRSTTAPGSADTGTSTSTMSASTSGTTTVTSTASAASTATVTSGQTATLRLITQTQGDLTLMYTAVQELATANGGVPASQSQVELQRVASDTSGYAGRAQSLASGNPAAPLLVKVNRTVSRAAVAVSRVPVTHTTQGRLLALTGPIRHLRSDVGRIGSVVTSRSAAHVNADLSTLSAQVAALTAGSASGSLSSTPPSTATSSTNTITTSAG